MPDSEITITIEGLNEMRSNIERWPAIYNEAKMNLFNSWGFAVEGQAKYYVPVDTGFLRSSISVAVGIGQDSVQVGPNAYYGPFVEFGTKPHFPPVAPLALWARRHGMPGGGFALALAISRYGTPPQPYMIPAFEQVNRERLPRFLEEFSADLVKGFNS